MIKKSLLLMLIIVSSFLGACQSTPIPQNSEEALLPSAEPAEPTSSNEISSREMNENLDLPMSPVSPLLVQSNTVDSSEHYALIQGKFVIKATGKPLAKTAYYLTPGVGDNKDEVPPVFSGNEPNNIQGFTDDNGAFVLDEISPGVYYVFIWAPLNWILLSETDMNGVDKPIPFHLQAGQVTDLGEFAVSWP